MQFITTKSFSHYRYYNITYIFLQSHTIIFLSFPPVKTILFSIDTDNVLIGPKK